MKTLSSAEIILCFTDTSSECFQMVAREITELSTEVLIKMKTFDDEVVEKILVLSSIC